MERCPTCQARLKDAPVCPRCKTDLSQPLSIQAQADAWLRRAIALLAAGDERAALVAVETSLRLKREALAVLLRGFLSQHPPTAEGALGPINAPEPIAGQTAQLPAMVEDSATEEHRTGAALAGQIAGSLEKAWHTLHIPRFP